MALAQRQAMYYILTGDTFDGKTAADLGLVNFAVPESDLAARPRLSQKS